nr:MAG TPA: hypothetical protein [Caudoviricetes sp.]
MRSRRPNRLIDPVPNAVVSVRPVLRKGLRAERLPRRPRYRDGTKSGAQPSRRAPRQAIIV